VISGRAAVEVAEKLKLISPTMVQRLVVMNKFSKKDGGVDFIGAFLLFGTGSSMQDLRIDFQCVP
jgi:hypothetical protein